MEEIDNLLFNLSEYHKIVSFLRDNAASFSSEDGVFYFNINNNRFKLNIIYSPSSPKIHGSITGMFGILFQVSSCEDFSSFFYHIQELYTMASKSFIPASDSYSYSIGHKCFYDTLDSFYLLEYKDGAFHSNLITSYSNGHMQMALVFIDYEPFLMTKRQEEIKLSFPVRNWKLSKTEKIFPTQLFTDKDKFNDGFVSIREFFGNLPLKESKYNLK